MFRVNDIEKYDFHILKTYTVQVYIHTYTHTHTYIYIYIYINFFLNNCNGKIWKDIVQDET